MNDAPFIASDLEAARRFYLATARTLGLDVVAWRSGFILGQPGSDAPIVRVRQAGVGPTVTQLPETRPVTLAARDDYSVRAFYRAALEAGGRQLGYPGPQPTTNGQAYYAARVADPDGNVIECGWRH